MEKLRKVSQGVKRLVLDVLKPYKPTLPELALHLGSMKGVEEVNITLVEVDQDTKNVKVTIEGDAIELNRVEKAVKDCGASIQSVDEVVVRKGLVEKAGGRILRDAHAR